MATPRPGGVQVELPVDELERDDVIVISAGGVIPVDAHVVEGHGLVDECLVRGGDGLMRKGAGDEVWAGSTLRTGELHVAVLRAVPESRGTLLARSMIAALAPASGARAPTRHGEAFAEQIVGPTFAMAGLGLLVGDVVTAGAILRPDYATGPGMAFPLETLQAIALTMRHGIVIRSPEALARIAAADLVVLDHHPALEQTELELDAVEVFPGSTEERVLGHAAAALKELDDSAQALLRGAASAGSCRRNCPWLRLAPT